MPDDPAEIGQNRALTREPDTVSTVVGKDAHMGYLVSHCTWTGLQCGIFYFGGHENDKQNAKASDETL